MKCKHGIPHGHDCCSICLGHKPSTGTDHRGSAGFAVISSITTGFFYFRQEMDAMGEHMEYGYDYGGADPYGI